MAETTDELVGQAREKTSAAIGVALLVAGLALVVGVLPAEFGVDPTGIGRRLGLLELSAVKQQVAAIEGARGATPTGQTVVPSERPFQRETVTFALAPREFVEYKYRLDTGQSLLYSWNATGAVNLEFHAEPDGAPKGYAETYEKRSSITGASGTLVAPFAGIHGWFWENTTDAPITVTLSSAGFYTVAHEFRKDTPTATRLFQ